MLKIHHLATAIAWLFMAFATQSFAEPKLPYQDGRLHEGVATCAGSACHGSNKPHADSPILQSEYYIWTREDRHAQAYKTLLNNESKLIGQRLGITPHKSPRCLNCHTDYVAEEQRGRRYRLSDGVGCEACHGGSEKWLESHVASDATHQKNLADGLFPTEDPVQRGRVCLSCHLGDIDHEIDHEIMGAGHPPLGFELDTFTAIQPAHYDLDPDYAERKGGIPTSMATWAAGQFMASQLFLQELASPRSGDGLFPELVFFDCYACHHELSAERWDRDSAPGLGVGKVRLHTVNLLMLIELLQVLEPADANKLAAAIKELHKNSQRSLKALQTTASNTANLVAQLRQKHADHSFSADQAWTLLDRISNKARKVPDFNLAEQTNMALEAIFLTLDRAGQIKADRSKKLRKALDKGYTYTNDSKDYSVNGFSAMLAEFRKALP